MPLCQRALQFLFLIFRLSLSHYHVLTLIYFIPMYICLSSWVLCTNRLVSVSAYYLQDRLVVR